MITYDADDGGIKLDIGLAAELGRSSYERLVLREAELFRDIREIHSGMKILGFSVLGIKAKINF